MKTLIKKVLSAGLPIPFFVKPVIRLAYKLGIVFCEGMVFLRKFFFVEPVLRSVATVGKGLRADRLPYIRGNGRLVIGNNVRLSGRSCFYFMNTESRTIDHAKDVASNRFIPRCAGPQTIDLGMEAEKAPKYSTNNSTTGGEQGADLPVIEIGDNTFIGNGCTISAARSVKIGKEVLISAGVRIHDNDGHPHDAAKRRAGGKIGENEIAEVKIGDGAWIGAGAMVMKGVEVIENEIVGAGAVLRKNRG